MSTSRKNYIGGSGKIRDTKYGPILLVSMKKEDIMNLPETKGYVHVIIAERKEEGPYGETHYMYENDKSNYKKDESKNEEPTSDKPPF